MEYTGKIIRVRFYNESNGFIVGLLRLQDSTRSFWTTGRIMRFDEHLMYTLKGEFVEHPKYGEQFNFISYEEHVENDDQELIRYLSSSLFKGIGKVQATKIVEALGKETIELIKEDIDVLDGIEGINEKKKAAIKEVLFDHVYEQEVIQYLMTKGITMHWIEEILLTYQDKSMEILVEEPYDLLKKVEGIPFKIVDQIGLAAGIEKQDPMRLKALIYAFIKEYTFKNGHTFIDRPFLEGKLMQLDPLIDYQDYLTIIDEMINKGELVIYGDKVLLDFYDESEKIIHDTLTSFLNLPESTYSLDKIQTYIDEYEKEEWIQLDESQKQSIVKFLNSPFLILTGGPGTGKTTLVKAMIAIYNQIEKNGQIALCAPTGRAAKRLNELTGLDAQTIHRLLHYDVQKKEFMVDSQHPLEATLLIVDEFSMVDSVLFSKLLLASSRVNKIIVIGDHEQLPSVGPGNVLSDLLQIEQIPRIHLEKVYRQKEHSGIVQLAHAISHQDMDELVFDEDVHFTSCIASGTLAAIKKQIELSLEQGYDKQDIQVLAPIYQGVAGIEAINTLLQDVLNPMREGLKQIQVGRFVFREGDKVLQLKNRVDDNVFNGDIGTIIEIIPKHKGQTSDKIVVDFDDQIIEYENSDFNSLTLAYCMSIHKAQGSEFKIVMMPILKDYTIMLRKNILYTGITRAKNQLYLFGDPLAFKHAIQTTNLLQRQTYLKERFNFNETDEELSPYDFM